jgi:hypothetical protein
MLKQVVTSLNMMPLVESIAIPFFGKSIGDGETFTPEETVVKSAHTLLAELHRWSGLLKTLRNGQ